MKEKLRSVLGQIEDPRREQGRKHFLNDILVIAIIAVISGAETWNNIEEFAKIKEGFLRGFLKLPNGIPSHDTFNRVFSIIDSEQFEKCFIDWFQNAVKIEKGELVSIDGKTIRGAKSNGIKSPFHIVSAWASKANLVLGQVMTDEKSNEITAIPQLIEALDLKGAVLTIDAMGCQVDIAKCIIDNEADYILAVKNNQKTLYEDVEFSFSKSTTHTTNKTIEGDHGRVETRVCSVINDLRDIEYKKKWKNLKSIIKIESTREFKNSNKPTEQATRYYISSIDLSAEYFQEAIRSHWAIENKLHWTLDVAFGEDASRKRAGNSARNFSLLLKIALNLLKKETSLKQGIKGKRLKAGWDVNYLLKVLGF
jgi:predicted transposase YbfD/YdcC